MTDNRTIYYNGKKCDEYIINISGSVKKITGECRNGMCYFALDTARADIPKTLDGMVKCYYLTDRVYSGIICTLTGRFYRHDVFIVSDIRPAFQYKDEITDVMVRNFQGVGKARASQVFDIIEKYYDAGRDAIVEAVRKAVPRMRYATLKRILNLFCVADEDLKRLEQLLLPYGVDESIILKMYDNIGCDAAEVIKKHPYRGIRYNMQLWVAEKIAFDSGVDKYDHERMRGLVHFIMRRSVKCGYTMVPWQLFYDAIDYYSGRYSYHQIDVPEICTVNAAVTDPAFCWDEEGLSYRKLYNTEKEIGQEAANLRNDPHYRTITDKDIDEAEKEIGVHYSGSQRKAFSLIERSGVSILTGGPGTGKTTVVKGLINRFRACDPCARVALCAPTGKAAKRLSEATGLEAKTIHKLIDYQPYGIDDAVYKTRRNPIEADLIVMDEASMVDTRLFYLFLQAIKPGTTVVVCGDEDQIPSVGPGNVLHDLIASGNFPYIKLRENFRQGEGSTIIDNANKILHGKVPQETKDFHLFRMPGEIKARDEVVDLVLRFYDKDDPFSVQVVQPSYRGDCGVDAVNAKVREMLGIDISERISYGDKVMFTHTNYKYGYVNGQMGVVSYIDGKEVVVDTDGISLTLPRSCLADIDTAYSITIHKSQGSEADHIILCLPETPDIMLQRALIYTAVTRARKDVWVVYVGDALEKSVRQNTSRYRPTRQTNLFRRAMPMAASG